MNLTGNTIFITGGGSGIGRGLAEALHARGNQIIIAGRRKARLEEVAAANPGIDTIELDIEDPTSIAAAAESLIAKYPKLNVLINNAGIAKPDGAQSVVDDALVTSIVTTNILGPIRMTSALIEQLKSQPASAIINVTSGLAFVPLAYSATYSATKAFMHSYSLSLRYLLKDTSVRVLDLAPPYVQTELGGERQAKDPRAMPLKDFIAETIAVLETDADEVLVESVKQLRNGAGPHDYQATVQLNNFFAAH
jgi:uncharacterized oxidoreductase